MTESAPSIQIDNNTFIHTASILRGNLAFGKGCVVHPLARIDAGNGKIVFGQNNIVEETAEIINKHPNHTLIIGDDNFFEVGSKCYALAVGSRNVLGQRCVVGEHVEITDGCALCARCEVQQKGPLPAQTCVYGPRNYRRKMASQPLSQQAHTDFLRTVLSNFGMAYRNKS